MSAWHAGEQDLQRRVGVAARMAEVGSRFVRDHMPEQHREFFADLPLVFTGVRDDAGQPWASLLAGPVGFAHSPTPQSLRLEAQPLPGDPAAAAWRVGAAVALLGLQAHTARRNRMNGWITEAGSWGCEVRVGQSFGNCPKYIHPREAVHVPASGDVRVRSATRLDDAAARTVTGADTFFIASAHPESGRSSDPSRGVDVSHRGGPAGFVRVQDDGSLLAPDYSGNSFFNTLGNLQLEPRCGLLFLDGASGTRLHLACRATLLDEPPDPATWPAALRLLRLDVDRVEHAQGGLPLRWREGE